MRVRVVVVSWNSGEVLPRCLAHLLATDCPRATLELMVVDNGSADGTTDGWNDRYPTVELRQTGRNLGFGGAANVGLGDLAAVDAVALVNPDAFVEPSWLTPLVDALLADEGVGAACPKIVFDASDDHGRLRINNVGNVLGPTWEIHDRGFGEPDRGQYDVPEEVWGWCGGAVLLRRSYLDDVGRFDERLFLYAEDADLSWRGRRRGWRYAYVPSSVVRHVHRASSGGERTALLDHLNRRNRLVVVTRHGGVRGATSAWSRALWGILVAVLREAIRPAVRRRPIDLAPLRRRCRAAVDAARMLLGGNPPIPGVDGSPRPPAP
jgi:N-acetylglucosaminyl-diphospho-decaprenol L-rhamnosyltransferase